MRRQPRRRSTLLLLVLASLSVLLLDARGEPVVDGVRDGAVDVLAPVRSGAATVLSPAGDLVAALTGGDDLDEENERLRRRVDELEGERAGSASERRALREALALLEIDWVGDMASVGARVVGAPVSNFEDTVELDKGTDDGIDEGMPVVAADGLVGRVVEVSGKRSRVRLLTDPASAVGVRLVRSGDTGSAEGDESDSPLSVLFIEPGTRVRDEDLAVTSGLEGGAFPADLPVGRVERAEARPGELSQDVRLRASADLDHLDLVRVLLWEPE
ncbi:MAG: rod shape-determining protein MreC [Acidimicrobiia bacterium]|nr:rod shape-determining protein MreC [Acidimicrobiia bacterium]